MYFLFGGTSLMKKTKLKNGKCQQNWTTGCHILGLESNQMSCWLIVSFEQKIVGKLRVASCVQQFFIFQLRLTKWFIWIVLNCWNVEEVTNHGSCEFSSKLVVSFSSDKIISCCQKIRYFNYFQCFFFDFFEMFHFFERLLGFNWEVSHMLTWKSERCHLFLKNLLELLLKQRFLWRMRDDSTWVFATCDQWIITARNKLRQAPWSHDKVQSER